MLQCEQNRFELKYPLQKRTFKYPQLTERTAASAAVIKFLVSQDNKLTAPASIGSSRRRILALAAALAIGFPMSASAQRGVKIGVGAVVPIGSSADRLNSGYEGVISYGFRPHWRRNWLRAEYAVNTMTEKVAGSPKQQMQSLTANIVFMGDQTSAPTGYTILGGGWYQRTGRTGRTLSLGVNAGAGIRFAAGSFGTFIEARLHYAANDTKTKYFPISFGLSF